MSQNPYCLALEELRNRQTHKLKEIGDQWRTPDALWWGIDLLPGIAVDLKGGR